MIIGKFKGILESNKNKIYIVTDAEQMDDAIREANKEHFRAKKDNLEVELAYMDDINDDEFALTDYEGCGLAAWAVSKKRKNNG